MNVIREPVKPDPVPRGLSVLNCTVLNVVFCSFIIHLEAFLIYLFLLFFGPVDARETYFGPCVVAVAYAAVFDSAHSCLAEL